MSVPAGVNIGHLWSEREMLNEEMTALLSLYQEGKIKPHIGRIFLFADAASAHRRIQERNIIGKVVLVP